MVTAVIFASKTGHTKAAANYIGSKIGAEVINIKKKPDVSKYDRIILGCGIYAGGIPKRVKEFAKENDMSKVSFFLTCLYKDEQGAEQLEKVANELGVADAIFFNDIKKQIADENSKLNEYIKSLE